MCWRLPETNLVPRACDPWIAGSGNEIDQKQTYTQLLTQSPLANLTSVSQKKVHRRSTSWFFLWFSNDFGVTRNSSSNADAMILASARQWTQSISELKQVTFLTTRTAWVTSEDWVKGCDWWKTSTLLPVVSVTQASICPRFYKRFVINHAILASTSQPALCTYQNLIKTSGCSARMAWAS
jgi:hypothetical protein